MLCTVSAFAKIIVIKKEKPRTNHVALWNEDRRAFSLRVAKKKNAKVAAEVTLIKPYK